MRNIKKSKRTRRHARIRTRVVGVASAPRLSVFRSNKNIYGQIIDDEKGMTLAAVSDKEEKGNNKVERAYNAGKAIAEKAQKRDIKRIVFDRGGFIYVGRVRAFAEGAREGGLSF